jgi:hypothetical protein
MIQLLVRAGLVPAQGDVLLAPGKINAWPEFFFKYVKTASSVHTGFFIQPGCPGQAVGVNAKPNLVFAAPVKFAKAVFQKSQRYSLTPPGGPDT